MTFTLAVTDSLDMPDITPDEVVIKVGNQPPVADAGDDQNVSTQAVVTLDGTNSSDPDGDYPLSYLWTQTGGPGVALSDPVVITPTFTAPSDPSVLTFTLSVTDSLGLPDPTPDEVVVTVENQTPVADAGDDQTVSTEEVAMLDGSGSSDPDGDYPLSYLWTQTGGPGVPLSNPTVVTPTFTAPSDPSALTFTLAVADSLGMPDPTPDEVVITVGNQPPVADAGDDQTVSAQEVVTLDGTNSSDPDGDYPLSYLWTQTGGPGVTLSDPTAATLTFTLPAYSTTLTFTLVVTDSLGMMDPTPDEVVVSVEEDEGYLVYLPIALR